jgi:ribosome-associated toxin RatA of RatAB toxin-antitoxin module
MAADESAARQPEGRPMADQTTSSIVVDAPPSTVMSVIADFAAYPTWAKGVTTAEVVVPGSGGRAQQVFFRLDVSPIKDEYTLAYDWSGDQQVTWTLVEGKMLRALDGAYVLTDRGDGTTDVTYRLSLDVSIPLIGMLKRKGEKILIDTALKGLKRRVESLG